MDENVQHVPESFRSGVDDMSQDGNAAGIPRNIRKKLTAAVRYARAV